MKASKYNIKKINDFILSIVRLVYGQKVEKILQAKKIK